ncbi:MAG: hypothetical protein U1F43_26235 [Myxococcota bacterium]
MTETFRARLVDLKASNSTSQNRDSTTKSRAQVEAAQKLFEANTKLQVQEPSASRSEALPLL